MTWCGGHGRVVMWRGLGVALLMWLSACGVGEISAPGGQLDDTATAIRWPNDLASTSTDGGTGLSTNPPTSSMTPGAGGDAGTNPQTMADAGPTSLPTDPCPDDPNKSAAGPCGCGVPDTDADADGTPDCLDSCPGDDNKQAPGQCGCDVPDLDRDSDGNVDCNEPCPDDPDKSEGGQCGCGIPDTDSDSDGVADCNDDCPADMAKSSVGICGCGLPDADTDSDTVLDCNDDCPADMAKFSAGICGCGVADTDTDNDGTADCDDVCPGDMAKQAAGVCGCGVSDGDSDSDGTRDCEEQCPADGNKLDPGTCGCGVSDADNDMDGKPDCDDVPDTPHCAPVRDWDPAWRQFEAEVLQLVNEARAIGHDCDTEGVMGPTTPVGMDPELRCAARLHSLDMGVRDFFAHTNPDNVGPGPRIAATGYSAWTWGENIAWGSQTPQDVVDGWLESDGHCSNIMHPGFEDLGVGYYYAAGTTPYNATHLWTQVFGTN